MVASLDREIGAQFVGGKSGSGQEGTILLVASLVPERGFPEGHRTPGAWGGSLPNLRTSRRFETAGLLYLRSEFNCCTSAGC